MRKIRLNIINRKTSWTGIICAGVGDRVIAACSHEPRDLNELEEALTIYQRSPAGSNQFSLGLQEGICWRHEDAGGASIDLGSRLIQFNADWPTPKLSGSVHFHNGRYKTPFQVLYQLKSGWRIVDRRSGKEYFQP